MSEERLQLMEEFRHDMTGIDPTTPTVDENPHPSFVRDPLTFKYEHSKYLFKIWSAGRLATESERALLEAELAALREELADMIEARDSRVAERLAALDGLQQRLTAAEQRNSACNSEIVAMVESALRRSFSLGQVYWQQADSDSTCQQNKSDQTMEVQAQHILNVIKSINDLTKPTESGASE